jgi:hypothetical protein
MTSISFLTSVIESPIVGTFVICFSRTAFVAETKPRLVVDVTANRNGDAVLLQFVATTRAMRATATLLFDTSIIFVDLSISKREF